MKIDSHQHFWNYHPVRDSWITEEMQVLKNDFIPSQLQTVLQGVGFDGCVTVQSQQNEDHNAFLLQYATQHDFIKGVVGWIDLQSTNLNKNLEKYSAYSKMRGFRHVIQAEPTGFMTEGSFIKGVNLLGKKDFTYDLLVRANQLPEALLFAQQIENTKIVIDHIAKPDIHKKELNHWRKYMRQISRLENVFCKVSGMVTEADWHSWRKTDFHPYLDSVVNFFGIDRLMYGSDWPVCLLAASYEQQLAIVMDYFSEFSQDERAKLFGLNAISFYKLRL